MAVYDAPDDAAAQGQRGRAWGQSLPQECPYALEDIAGYDPFDKNAEPRGDVWPAPVALVLNEVLGTSYPVLSPASERGQGLSR